MAYSQEEEKDSWVRAGCVVVSGRIRSSPSFIVTDHIRRVKHLESYKCKPVVIPAGIGPSADFGQYSRASWLVGSISSLTPRDIYYSRGVRVRLLNLKNYAGDLDDDHAIAPFYADKVFDFKLYDLVTGNDASAQAAKVYFEEMFEVDDIADMVMKPIIGKNYLLKLGKHKTTESRAVMAREFPHIGLF